MFTKRITFCFVYLALALQLVAACSPSAQNLQGENWTIFPEQQASKLGVADWVTTSGHTADYWTPTQENVFAIEEGAAVFLQENADRFYAQGTPVWERLDEYNRQYVGLVLDEKRIVYANFFCDSFETDWRTEFVFVLDGGDCFFRFKYDVDSDTFFDLQVNGVG